MKLRFALVSLVAIVACKKKEQEPAKPAEPPPAPAPVVVDATAAAPAPTPDAAEATAPAPTTTPPPAQAAGLELDGPYASIADYCKKVKATFKKDACFSQMDNMEMCACGAVTKNDITGKLSAGGTTSNLKKATLVAVADNAADYVHCSLAIQMADGWRFAHRLFPCNAAPMSHDGGVTVKVKTFDLSQDVAARTETLSLAFISDDGGAKTEQSLTCTLGPAEAAPLACTALATK
jgi:hypothetical protein